MFNIKNIFGQIKEKVGGVFENITSGEMNFRSVFQSLISSYLQQRLRPYIDSDFNFSFSNLDVVTLNDLALAPGVRSSLIYIKNRFVHF
jgi:hypothetical protein